MSSACTYFLEPRTNIRLLSVPWPESKLTEQDMENRWTWQEEWLNLTGNSMRSWQKGLCCEEWLDPTGRYGGVMREKVELHRSSEANIGDAVSWNANTAEVIVTLIPHEAEIIYITVWKIQSLGTEKYKILSSALGHNRWSRTTNQICQFGPHNTSWTCFCGQEDPLFSLAKRRAPRETDWASM